MTKRLGRTYYGFVGVVACAGAAAFSLPNAEAADPVALASGYGTAPEAGSSSEQKARVVDRCLDAAADRYDAEVSLAQINRAWRGTEGWIVDLSLDVSRDGKKTRRRDVACRQGEHGLQVARY